MGEAKGLNVFIINESHDTIRKFHVYNTFGCQLHKNILDITFEEEWGYVLGVCIGEEMWRYDTSKM